ncbi:hypothetical protein BOH78_3974 [Pichia kudriavzevii]|uniref:Uncharacterized protein n=1 Tax=Pichia kudriavzevii TaxID=4909 RepID=A0A099NTD3_PICKU|nr:hypothetical protein JL09_g5678 [Pichia kudriavzevii]ONH72246.1 hypothetical protein BOH78_3974 [Pichia kudriavzevii]
MWLYSLWRIGLVYLAMVAGVTRFLYYLFFLSTFAKDKEFVPSSFQIALDNIKRCFPWNEITQPNANGELSNQIKRCFILNKNTLLNIALQKFDSTASGQFEK